MPNKKFRIFDSDALKNIHQRVFFSIVVFIIFYSLVFFQIYNIMIFSKYFNGELLKKIFKSNKLKIVVKYLTETEYYWQAQ